MYCFSCILAVLMTCASVTQRKHSVWSHAHYKIQLVINTGLNCQIISSFDSACTYYQHKKAVVVIEFY